MKRGAAGRQRRVRRRGKGGSEAGSIVPVYRIIILRRFRGNRRDPEPGRRQRVIAAMPVMLTPRPLFLDVGDLAAGGDLAVMTGHAPARK